MKSGQLKTFHPPHPPKIVMVDQYCDIMLHCSQVADELFTDVYEILHCFPIKTIDTTGVTDDFFSCL